MEQVARERLGSYHKRQSRGGLARRENFDMQAAREWLYSRWVATVWLSKQYVYVSSYIEIFIV